MKRPTLRRATSLVVPSSEWLVLLSLLVASVPPVLVRHESLTALPTINLLDGSWILDTGYKASGGIWLGRDVAFTYGPLFQWISSAPSRWIGTSIGTIYATWYTLPMLLIVLATFLTARLLLPDAAPWGRALLVLLAVVFWSPPDLRVSLCLLAFAFFLRVTDAAASGAAVTLGALTCSTICAAAFWLSADTGLYISAALLLCVAATVLVGRRTAWRMATFILIAAGFFAGFVLLTNAILFSPLDFQYWRSSLAIAEGYRWFEPLAMTKSDKRLLLETLGLAFVVFGVAWHWRRAAGHWTRRPALLISGFCLALLILQSAVVRSDHGHVLMGIYPALFLCGTIAIGATDGRLLSTATATAVVIATVALASAYPLYKPVNAQRVWRQILHPLVHCPADMRELDRACLSPADAELFAQVSAYVNAQTAPGSRISVFPYETAFGLASRHQVAGGVLQSYLVNGEYLTELELAGLRRSNPPLALYFPERAISVEVDSIPNFTRSPELWFYLVENYRAAGNPAPGVVGLLRDETRAARLRISEAAIGGPIGPTAIRKRSSSIDLAVHGQLAAGSDFLKMHLRASYPIWWRLRKPSKLALKLSFADGAEKIVQFVIEPNQASDIWIFPWDSLTMADYFSVDEGQWRRGRRPALVGLKLLVNPYDWLSVLPSSITIDKIEAVQLKME
ncbi:MAG TPA: hypothetical protein VLW48_03455 [Candidatus Bathyarchaeia archaeon]|nr:hypothetical protein [Candidatus Bathyarchaeia archaeon]